MTDEFTRYSNVVIMKSKSSILNVYIKNWLSVYLEHPRNYLVTVEEIHKNIFVKSLVQKLQLYLLIVCGVIAYVNVAISVKPIC